MRKELVKIALGSFVSLMAVSAYAGELIVTPVVGKGNIALAFDLSSEGGVGGLNFSVKVPGMMAKRGQTASCVLELPRGFEGACAVQDGIVRVYAVSNSPDVAIAAGVASVGKIVLDYSGTREKLRADSGIKVEDLALFDNAGAPIRASSKVSAE